MKALITDADIQNWEGQAEAAMRAAVTAKGELEVAKARVAAFKAERQEPVAPTMCASLHEYARFMAERQSYQGALQAEEFEIARCTAVLQELEVMLKNLLPEEVWFRIDGHEIGLAFSNWGGDHHYLEIREWSEELPSLNHRYEGD